MEIGSLHDLFVYELRGAYRMELRLVDSLDEMAINATNTTIGAAFAEHRKETKDHVERVRESFRALDRPPEEGACPVVEALDRDRRAVEERVADRELLNLFYLGAGMKAERVEITVYESLGTMGDRLDLDDAVTDPLAANRASEERTLRGLRLLTTASDLKALWRRFLP